VSSSRDAAVLLVSCARRPHPSCSCSWQARCSRPASERSPPPRWPPAWPTRAPPTRFEEPDACLAAHNRRRSPPRNADLGTEADAASTVVALLPPEGEAALEDGTGVEAQAPVADATPPLSCVERRMPDATMRGVAARIAADAGRGRAREALRREVGDLDGRCWLVERDMQLGGTSIPFVLFGPYGVVVLSASEVWTMRDVSVVWWAADDLAGALPDYPNPIRSGI